MLTKCIKYNKYQVYGMCFYIQILTEANNLFYFDRETGIQMCKCVAEIGE